MAISLAHINTQSTRVFMGTFTNGEAIHAARTDAIAAMLAGADALPAP